MRSLQFRGRPFDLEGVRDMSDFRKKYPADCFRAKKNLARKYLPYNGFVCPGKNSITEGLGEKFLREPNHPCAPCPIQK